MVKKVPYLLLIAFLVTLAACSGGRVDDTQGTVILTVSGFDGLPIRASVNFSDLLQVEEFELSNVPKDPNGTTSALQDIELESYQVVYTRADAGTRVPPTKVNGIFGIVPVNGQDMIMNLDVMGRDQFRNPPLSDLLVENGGVDSETGSDTISLNLNVRFFGRTLSGDRVASNTASFVVEFIP